jgi:hypothetical protein
MPLLLEMRNRIKAFVDISWIAPRGGAACYRRCS